MSDGVKDKVLGCIIGATIGDAVGNATEGLFREQFINLSWNANGEEWLEDMMPLEGKGPHPLGTWLADAPRGTGTDDTRLNHIFIQCVSKNRGRINSKLLAIEYVERFLNLEKYVPTYFTEEDVEKLAKPFYGDVRNFFVSCAHLGMTEIPGLGDISQKIYPFLLNDFPRLNGLLRLQSAGLLFKNDPEKAYKKTVELDYIDIGYARDATALLAAIVSAALSDQQLDAKEIIDIGIKTDPYHVRGPIYNRMMTSKFDETWTKGVGTSLPRLFEAVNEAKNDREAVLALARECEWVEPFSPMDILGVPMAIIRYTRGDPVRSIIMAANHRKVDENGRLIRFRDTDCTAMIAGTIVGAIKGLSSFPKDWVRDAIQANKKVYEIDIEKNARDLYHAVYQQSLKRNSLIC